MVNTMIVPNDKGRIKCQCGEIYQLIIGETFKCCSITFERITADSIEVRWTTFGFNATDSKEGQTQGD